MFCSLSLCVCWRPTTLKIQLRHSWRILAQTIPNKQSCVERPCLITKWLDLYYQNNIPWNMTFLIHSIFILMKFTILQVIISINNRPAIILVAARMKYFDVWEKIKALLDLNQWHDSLTSILESENVQMYFCACKHTANNWNVRNVLC